MVYLVIFRIRVAGLRPPGQYVLLIFAGRMPFLMTSEVLSDGVASVIANKTVLNKTVFPIDLAPPKAVLRRQVTVVVGLGVILLVSPYVGTLSWTVALLPLEWVLHVMAFAGVVWVLSLGGLVFRDLQNLVQLLLMVMMIASPITYVPAMVPAALRPLVDGPPNVLTDLRTCFECVVRSGSGAAATITNPFAFPRLSPGVSVQEAIG